MKSPEEFLREFAGAPESLAAYAWQLAEALAANQRILQEKEQQLAAFQ